MDDKIRRSLEDKFGRNLPPEMYELTEMALGYTDKEMRLKSFIEGYKCINTLIERTVPMILKGAPQDKVDLVMEKIRRLDVIMKQIDDIVSPEKLQEAFDNLKDKTGDYAADLQGEVAIMQLKNDLNKNNN